MQTIAQTGRLTLRHFTPADLPALIQLHSDPQVMRYITDGQPDDPARLENEVLPRWISQYEQFSGWGFFAAEDAATGEFIGWFHLRPTPDNPAEFDLGYRLHRNVWGKGLATEGSRALLAKLAFANTATRIIARCMSANTASQRVMQKLGLSLEGNFTETRFPGECQCAMRYSLDWSTIIHRRVWACRQGVNPTCVRRLASGWVVLGDTQTLRGYTLLLSDPIYTDLNHAPAEDRAAFLRDMGLLGDALLKATDASLINYMILGNTDRALHAHVFARYADEDPAKRVTGPWAYFPPFPQVKLDLARDAELLPRLVSALDEARL